MTEPAPRAQIPDSAFLLRPVNREYLRGEIPTPAIGRELPVFFSAVLLVGGLLGLASSGLDLYRRRLLHVEGASVDAEVVSAYYDREERGRRVRYRFTAGGQVHERLGVPDDALFARAQRERRIRVVYDPAEPARSRIANPGGWTRRAVGAGLGVLVTLAGTVMLWLALGTRRLLARGRVSVGELVECTRRSTRDGGVRIEASFRFSAEGRERRGRTRAPRVDLREGELPQPGTPVAVLHHGRRQVML